MKKIFLDFLSKGTIYSSMRLGSITIVFTSCLYIISYTFVNLIITAFNIFCQHHYASHTLASLLDIDWEGAAWFAGAGLLGKAGQSFAENKIQKQKEIVQEEIIQEKKSEIGEIQKNPVKEVG